MPREAEVHVLCQSKDKGKLVKSYCTVGCTACKLCAKQSKAFDVSAGLSVMQYDFEGDIPSTAHLVCVSQTIFDSREHDLIHFVTDPKVRERLKEKQTAYKEEQKRLKAEKKAKKEKAKAAKEAKAAEAAEKAKAEEGKGEPAEEKPEKAPEKKPEGEAEGSAAAEGGEK